MGSYSNLLALDRIPDKDFKYNDKCFNIADFKYDYPYGIGILLQNNPTLCVSPVWSNRTKQAIIAEYDEKNVDKFVEYLKHVAEKDGKVWSNKEGATVQFTDTGLFDRIGDTLKTKLSNGMYILFDMADVIGMGLESKDLEDDSDEAYDNAINRKVESILNDFRDPSFMEKLYAGKFLDSLDSYTRGAFWELLDKSNSSVNGFKSAKPITNKKGKILLVKENTDMDKIKGLFNLAGFESAGDNDILEMNINEETEIKDKCPSINPEEHFDAANSGNKQIPVPGGDKEQPSVKADEKEIPVPGGDSEKPDAKTKDETPIQTGKKVLLDDDTYNAALDNLQKSFKEAVNVISMIRNAEVVHKTEADLYNDYMESAMDNAFIDYSYGPLFEKVTAADKDSIKKITKDISGKVAKFVDDQNADYTFYKPHTWARFILTFGADPKAWQHILNTRMWQVLGCVTCEGSNINKLCDLITKEFKEELGDYKIISFKAFPSFIDVWRMKFNFQNQLSVYFLLVDKKLPAEFKEAEESAKKEEKKEESEEKKD